jgi:hypothetical protein
MECGVFLRERSLGRGRFKNPTARATAYLFLVERDTEKCFKCGRRPPEVRLEINHIDGDPFNNNPKNLNLMCHPCNVSDSWIRRRSPDFCSPTSERERKSRDEAEGERRGLESFDNARDPESLERDFSDCSVEIRKSMEMEPTFRTWLMDQIIMRKEPIPRKEAIYSGAERVGGSPETVERYLHKLTSPLGPLREYKGEFCWLVDYKKEIILKLGVRTD